MRTHSRWLAVAFASMLVLGAVGCGGGGDESTAAEDASEATGPADETTTTDLPATIEPLPPEEQVWNDLVAATGAVTEVSAAPDPEAPELARHFTGESLQSVQDAMRDMQAGGGADTSIEVHRYSVTVAGETATIDYCFTSTTRRLDTAGNATGSSEETSMRATAQVQLIDDIWKIAQQTFTPEECPVP